MESLIEVLRRNAAQYPDTVAVKASDETLTYAELLQRVEAEAQRLLNEEKLTPGTICQFCASQDATYLIKFLSLHVAGVICAPVDMINQNVRAFCNTAVSDILFTTGTTSRPKGVLLSWDAVMCDADNLIRAHGYRHGLTFVICGPIHHFGCWSKVMPTLVVGGTVQILQGLKDTEALLQALGDAPRSATFLVPSAIRMLLQLCPDRLASLAEHIDFIETGAAPIPTTDMEQLRQLLPHTRLYNTYASTETGVVCTYPFHLPSAVGDDNVAAEPCVAGCVGSTMHHAHVDIDEFGHIVVSGPMLMSGYLPFDADGQVEKPAKMITSDIGQLDERGYLFITGRESDFINVGGLKVSPAEVEEVAQSLETIQDCICIPTPHPLMGQVPRLLVVMKPGNPYDRKELIRHLKAHLEPFKIPLFYQEVEEIRKTFNGKKDRKSYLS